MPILHTSVWLTIETTLLYLCGAEKEIYTSNCNILFKGSINFIFDWDLRNLCRGGPPLRRVRYIGYIDWSRNRTLCSEGTPIICQTPTCLTEPLQIYEKYMSIPLCGQVISTLVVLGWYFIQIRKVVLPRRIRWLEKIFQPSFSLANSEHLILID